VTHPAACASTSSAWHTQENSLVHNWTVSMCGQHMYRACLSLHSPPLPFLAAQRGDMAYPALPCHRPFTHSDHRWEHERDREELAKVVHAMRHGYKRRGGPSDGRDGALGGEVASHMLHT
jgi:hypothetical protein